MLYWMIRQGKKQPSDPLEKEFEQEIPKISTPKALLWFTLGLVVLIISSRGLVWGSVNIAKAAGISDLVIGLTIVAIGTSLPELAASIISALKKEHDIAIGNIIGSNMFNILVVLGIPGLISPHIIDPAVLNRDFPLMIGLSVVLFLMAYGFKKKEGHINRLEGSLLLGGAANIEKGLNDFAGITEIKVDIESNVVSVQGSELDKTVIENKLAELGYPAV